MSEVGGGESFSEPQWGIALLEVRSVQTGFAVPNSVGRRTRAGAAILHRWLKKKRTCNFAPFDFIGKVKRLTYTEKRERQEKEKYNERERER